MVDLNNPVVRLCMEGARAEFEGRLDDAGRLYDQARQTAADDYEACIAAHYVAHYLTRVQGKPEDVLHWNLEALRRARAVADDRVKDFLPSLYLNLGRSYELVGDQAQAQAYYDLAAGLGVVHRPERDGRP